MANRYEQFAFILVMDASGGIMTTEADQFALPGAALQLPEILCLYLIN